MVTSLNYPKESIIMKISFLFFLCFFSFVSAKYMDNHSCKECHEKIYEEYETSAHAQGYFGSILHRKIADKVSTKKYECARCHMPMANNIEALMDGKARPDSNNKTHTDAVSCYFCHTIAYVQKAHTFNINTKAKQAKGYKPTLYGRLKNPDEGDKHSSTSTNPIYAKKVCMGCHSHKLNDNNVTIFRAMKSEQNSLGCIRCHMPKVPGGVEKVDKRARGEHVSHKFLGIHDVEFRKTGVELNITVKNEKLIVTLHNKMEHPLIIQPARAKFLKIEVHRGSKVIWNNYLKTPSEDKQGYFAYSFKENGKDVIIPAHASKGEVYNLEADEKKVLHYSIPKLQKGDEVKAGLYVRLAKSDCQKVIDLDYGTLSKNQLIKEIVFIQD